MRIHFLLCGPLGSNRDHQDAEHGKTKTCEIVPLREWTVLKMKREMLERLGLLKGNKSKPDKQEKVAQQAHEIG